MNAHNFLVGIVKTVSGLYGSPATEFETIKIPDRAYVDLYRQGVALPSGQHSIQADVDILRFDQHEQDDVIDSYILIVKASFSPGHTEVIDYFMIDENCTHIDCDFDCEAFEDMFI